jgi:cytochrome c
MCRPAPKAKRAAIRRLRQAPPRRVPRRSAPLWTRPTRRTARRSPRSACNATPSTRAASADAKAGADLSKKCAVCHTFDKGGANKIGPNLFGIMADNIASVPGYQFSSALAADKDKKWDPDELNVWLYKPQQFAKGTKMTFAGLPKAQDRADVIAYLQTLK